LEGLVLLAWILPWGVGGWLIADRVFHLRRGETAIAGFALGMILQTWLANLISHVIVVPLSFWIAAVLVLLGGIAAVVRSGSRPRFEVNLWQWVVLGGLTLLFNAIGRGLGVFDDYQNLPTVSLMATGDVPPHFALDPRLRFGYHHLLLLFAAEMMRVGNMLPWSALDLARGLMLALPLVLAGLWAYRITRNGLAAVLTACFLAFAGGARWVMLLLPSGWVNRISAEITLIGSAASSAANLSEALISSWKIDGAGPIPFPFAFHSGINPPYIMAYTGIAGSGTLILLLLLLTAGRWRHPAASVVTVGLLSAMAIANEIAFLLLGLGLLVVAIASAAMPRKPGSARQLLVWLGAAAVALVIAIVQGGMLTEIVRARLLHDSVASGYFDPTPVLTWPPAIVSAHLGALSLGRPLQVVSALLEIGPVVLATPLVLAWGWRALRLGRWYEASLTASSLGVLIAAMVSFKGPLFTAAPRLMSGWFLICSLLYIPILWISWKRRRDAIRYGLVAGALVGCLGGLILFGIQLAAIQRPVYATFITPMDAKMAQEQWNRLAPGTLVFDPLVFRAPTVFGRATRSSPTWYIRSAEWEMLRDQADPYELRSSGFAYMYFDSDYWEELSERQRAALGEPCVKELGQVDGIHSETDYTKDFRRLLDIQACE
jgi:hypothetical protein